MARFQPRRAVAAGDRRPEIVASRGAGACTRRATAGVVALGVAAALTLVAVALGADNRVHATAIPPVVRAVEEARAGKPIPARLTPPFKTIKLFPPRYRISRGCFPHRRTRVAPITNCRVGDTSSKRLIVLLGDSHAFMWSPALLVMAHNDGWAVVPLMRFGCTPEKWFSHRGPGGPICRAWLRWAFRRVRQLHPTVTLLGASVGETATPQARAATAGMISAARKLKPLGPLVVIGDPEGLSSNPVECLTSPQATLASCLTTWPASSYAAYDAIARAAKSFGAGFLPTRGFVCYQRQCPAVVGHTIVWMDTSHLTGIYSAQTAGPFRAAFLHAMSVARRPRLSLAAGTR